GGSFSVSPLAARSGRYGLVEGANSSLEAAYQTISGLAPGQPYVISAWVMLGSGTPGAVFLRATDPGSDSACSTPLITVTAQWQQISCTYTATSFQAVTVILAQNWGPFSTYWDDIALTPVPPVNGGFESGTFSNPWTTVLFSGGTGAISVS